MQEMCRLWRAWKEQIPHWTQSEQMKGIQNSWGSNEQNVQKKLKVLFLAIQSNIRSNHVQFQKKKIKSCAEDQRKRENYTEGGRQDFFHQRRTVETTAESKSTEKCWITHTRKRTICPCKITTFDGLKRKHPTTTALGKICALKK